MARIAYAEIARGGDVFLERLGVQQRIGGALADPFEDLSRSFDHVRRYTAAVAYKALKDVQKSEPAMADAVIYVDGKKDRPLEDVKAFGKIVMVAPHGPVQEAVDLAHEFVAMATGGIQNPTGFYARAFAWYKNGKLVGSRPPNLDKFGLRSNVQLVNFAGYASMPEIFLPDGVIYGAFRQLKRVFGERIALSFSYGPAHAYAQAWPPTRRRTQPLAVPVLTIGHPSASFKRLGTVPGVRRRARVRAAKRAAQSAS
jgi:hypothetical protein